jgi:hypothetical protein
MCPEELALREQMKQEFCGSSFGIHSKDGSHPLGVSISSIPSIKTAT